MAKVGALDQQWQRRWEELHWGWNPTAARTTGLQPRRSCSLLHPERRQWAAVMENHRHPFSCCRSCWVLGKTVASAPRTPRRVRAAVALQKQRERPEEEEEEPEQLVLVPVPVPVQEATPSLPDRWCRC